MPQSASKTIDTACRPTEPAMPSGRVLRTVESLKVRRRMDTAAAELVRRPRLARVHAAVCNLTVGYSRLHDAVSLEQVATAARVGCVRNVGRDLGELAELGLIGYWPARGRGRRGVLEVPARFAPEVVLRLGLRATLAPACPAPEQHDPTEGQPQKVPEAEPVSPPHPSYPSPKEKTPPAPSPETAAANSATPPEGESTAPTFDVDPGDVDRVLNSLPAKLRTSPESGDRSRQAHWIRRLLHHGHVPIDIAAALSLALPSLVGSPAGLVEFRAQQLLRDRVGRRARAALDAQHRETQLAADRAAAAAAAAAKPQRYTTTHRLPLPMLALLAELPVATMTTLVHAATSNDDLPLPTRGEPVSPVALAVLDLLEHQVGPLATVTTGDVSRWADSASCAVSGRDEAAAVGESVRRWARLLRDAPRPAQPSSARPGPRPPLPVDGDVGEGPVCVACGAADATAVPRPSLPLASACCQTCFDQASAAERGAA